MRRRIIFILLILVLVFGFFAFRAALSLKYGLSSAQKAAAAIKVQNLDETKKHLKDAREGFNSAKNSLVVFTPFRIIPIFGWYIADAQRGVAAAAAGLRGAETLTEAITPYADVLGFQGQGTFLGGTAQERVAKALETLSKVTPQLDAVGKDLGDARREIDKIQAWRYPNFLPGKPGDKITTAKETIDQIESLVVESKPLLVVLPEIMGQDTEKKYMVLFQNDKELRSTGGFITAFAYFRVNKGNIAAEGSEDIYRLDDTLLKKLPAPPELRYLPNVPTLNLRDSNFHPDYFASMKQFEELYKFTSDQKDIDGIIALDTHFVLSLMKILGDVEAYGVKFTTDNVDACACPQIIYELERYADEPKNYERGARKDIIGVLMKQMMDMAFNAPKSAWPKLVSNGIENLRQKHLILYFKDPKLQEAAEKMNFAGRIHEYDGDYLYINEANLAGAKSNMYIKEEVKQQIKKDKEGNINKKVTIEYKYPRRGDNCSLERKGGLCLAGTYRDWIRIYVPKGSKLIKGAGAETQFSVSEEYGKTVFDAFFTVRPEGTAKLEIEYSSPIKVEKEYKLLIQKQPGVEGHTYEIDAFGKKQRDFPLDTDKELIVKL